VLLNPPGQRNLFWAAVGSKPAAHLRRSDPTTGGLGVIRPVADDVRLLLTIGQSIMDGCSGMKGVNANVPPIEMHAD
jgi:hypothetical protein